MEDLRQQFKEETKLSFDAIPINGVHLEYISWIEKRIEALSLGSVMRWVAVSERLPETKQQVLVIRTNPEVVTTGYIHEYGHWIWSNLNGSTHKADHIYKVTHWMPLPEPPPKK